MSSLNKYILQVCSLVENCVKWESNKADFIVQIPPLNLHSPQNVGKWPSLLPTVLCRDGAMAIQRKAPKRVCSFWVLCSSSASKNSKKRSGTAGFPSFHCPNRHTMAHLKLCNSTWNCGTRKTHKFKVWVDRIWTGSDVPRYIKMLYDCCTAKYIDRYCRVPHVCN